MYLFLVKWKFHHSAVVRDLEWKMSVTIHRQMKSTVEQSWKISGTDAVNRMSRGFFNYHIETLVLHWSYEKKSSLREES